MSALPSAVAKQIERSKQIQKDYYEKGIVPGMPAPEPTAEEVAAKEKADKEAADKAAADAAAANASKPGEQQQPAPQPSLQQQDDWKQKYLVLQGKYNSEVPRLQGQLREQGQQIATLREETQAMTNLLASLNQQQRPAPAQSQPSANKLVKDEEVKEFGADLIDVIRRAAREEMGALSGEIDKRVAPLKQQVESVQQTVGHAAQRQQLSDRDRVLAMLAQQVPNYEQINVDPAFMEWLDQVDPYSGQQRGNLLKDAFTRFDGPRVVSFFLGFQNENAAITRQQAPAAAPASAAPQKTLESLVAPGTPKAGPQGAPDESGKRIWTRAEVGRAYQEKSAGKYATRKADWEKLEKEIFKAQAEGRIR